MAKGRALAAVAATVAVLLVAQTASAQYPPPRGALICVVSQISIQTQGNAQVAATLRDAAGSAVVGQTVFFSIIAQPGGTASLTRAATTTDGAGVASAGLAAGSAPGQIVVRASSSDGLECRVLLDVLAVVTVQPPKTGDSGLADINRSASGLPDSLLIEAVVVLTLSGVFAGGAAGWLHHRSRTRRSG